MIFFTYYASTSFQLQFDDQGEARITWHLPGTKKDTVML